MADHYEVLQVHPCAEAEVIRAAFRALARKYHPDFGGDPRRMAALNEAWNVLGHRGRRAEYDSGRRGVQRPSAARSSHPASSSTGPASARHGRPSGPIAAAAERAEARADARADAQAEARAAAGDPVSRSDRRAGGTVLDFGRYEGWTVRALVDHDPDYLLWLARTPIGRPFRAEIDGLMAIRHGPSRPAGVFATAGAAGSGGTATATRSRPSLFRLRTR